MSTQRRAGQRGKAAEKRAAETLQKHGLRATRILRGSDWSQSLPDVAIEGWEELKIDSKHYARHAHHRLFEEIEAKYCRPGSTDRAVLITSERGKTGQLATIRLELLAHLLRMAEEWSNGRDLW